eukprot:3941644-Rhodomonas_salina.6
MVGVGTVHWLSTAHMISTAQRTIPQLSTTTPVPPYAMAVPGVGVLWGGSRRWLALDPWSLTLAQYRTSHSHTNRSVPHIYRSTAHCTARRYLSTAHRSPRHHVARAYADSTVLYVSTGHRVGRA